MSHLPLMIHLDESISFKFCILGFLEKIFFNICKLDSVNSTNHWRVDSVTLATSLNENNFVKN